MRHGLEQKSFASLWVKLEDNDRGRLRNKRRKEGAGRSVLHCKKRFWSLGINGETRGVTRSAISQVYSVCTWTSV